MKTIFRQKGFAKIFISVCGVVFLFALRADAAGTPEIMSGETKATISGEIYYGGLNGNYAVYNPDANINYGFNTEKLSLANCPMYSGSNPVCFLLGTGINGTTAVADLSSRLMTSTTRINGKVSYVLPALYFSGLTVTGDVSSDLSYLNSWGLNLLKGNGVNSSGFSWNLKGYAYNSKAQITWTSEQFNKYMEKINTLKSGAATGSIQSAMYLQGSVITDIGESDANVYPDGKVWAIGSSSTMSSDVTYHGTGTVIINGNLTVNQNIDIVRPASDTTSRLGIIVLGDCNFKGGNEIDAMVMCTGKMTVKNGSIMTGSFVAKDFSVDSGSYVRFIYDQALDDNQPPGFRNLDLSTSTEVGNN